MCDPICDAVVETPDTAASAEAEPAPALALFGDGVPAVGNGGEWRFEARSCSVGLERLAGVDDCTLEKVQEVGVTAGPGVHDELDAGGERRAAVGAGV